MEAVVGSKKVLKDGHWSGFVKKGGRSLMWFQGRLRVNWVELGYVSV